jgi:hypothetical protein
MLPLRIEWRAAGFRVTDTRSMRRSAPIWLALVLAALAALPVQGAAAARLPNVIADDLSPPLAGWSESGDPRVRGVRTRPRRFLYPTNTDALVLGPGGSIRRTLPPRPWSLSLDVRVLGDGVLEIDLGGEPLVLRGAGGWKHVQVAGFEPAEVHVAGSRVVHGVRPGRAIRLRVRRGSAQLTGLVATGRDDRAALVLHRLAELHSMTPAKRYPLGRGSDGVLRYSNGWTSGFYAGALWRGYDLTRSSLFKTWALRATLDHNPPGRRAYDVGLREYEAAALAYDHLCDSTRRVHRCRVLNKHTSGAAGTLFLIALGNPGTGALPIAVWPNRCPSCASSDEVETRADSVMQTLINWWQWRRDRDDPSPNSDAANRDRQRDFALHNARTVARLFVRADGSTEHGVRTNRLDGTVLSYERPAWVPPGGTRARTHAQALYGFAQLGGALAARDLLEVAERLAGFLERSVPAGGVPRAVLGEGGAGLPEDTAAGALAAAGLLKLAAACERVSGACADGARWAALGRSLLDAVLSHVQPHLPMGVLLDQVHELAGTPYDTGEFLIGLDYALEAVAMAGSSNPR